MTLTVNCKHGVRLTVTDVADMSNTYMRLFIRNVLLACPACWADATGYLEEPGL